VINDLWYKNAIIYCLSVGTYMDANGDGIGDFIGLTRRLDYLQGLGITAIWLMPFQVSPGRDDGYDVAIMASIRATARSVILSNLRTLRNSAGSGC
jgi:maltose alpha-D-glucosyltransferase/alpha-amylase